MKLILCFAALLCAGQEDVPVPTPPIVVPETDSKVDKIIFPMEISGGGGKVEPQPLPAPQPEPSLKIVSAVELGKLYIIQSPSEVFFRQLPISVATITDVRAGLPADVKDSPVVVSAVFAGGNGQPETKVFRAAYIYRVDPLKAGETSLVSVPKGVNLDSEVITSALVVSNTAPNPPPEPEPEPLPIPVPPEPEPVPPEPEPEPEPDGRVDHIHVSVVQDTRNISQSTAKTLNCLLGWEVFITSGNTYLTYYNTTGENGGTIAIEVITKAGVLYPALSVRDKATNRLMIVAPFPQTCADLKATLNACLKVPL